MNEWDSMVIYGQWPYMTMLGLREVVLQFSVREYKLTGCCLRKVARNRRFCSKIVLTAGFTRTSGVNGAIGTIEEVECKEK
jgi:hypothetical protein